MFNLGRILTGLATVAAVLVGAALGAPALMNWDHLREPVEREARALVGGDVRVDGRITVQLLPLPRISLSDVVIEPGSGLAVSGDFARARVHLKIRPLLSGRAVPAALEFSDADLVADRRALAERTGMANLSLPVTVRGGAVRFDPESHTADFSDLVFFARPVPEGGTKARLHGTFEGTPFSVRAAFDGDGPAALRFVRLDFGEGQAFLSYARREAAGGANVQVKLTRGGQAAAFLGRAVPALGRVVEPEQIGRLGSMAVAASAVPEEDGFALRGLEVTAGPLRLTGEGRLQPGPRPLLDMELGAQTLVLGEGEKGYDPTGLLRVIGQLAEWGEGFDGGIRLYAEHILAGGTVLRNSEIRLRMGPEGTRLERFRAGLPRGISVAGTGIPAGEGQLAAAVRVEGARVHDLFAGMGETEMPEAEAQAPLSVEGNLVLSGTRAVLNDVRIAAGRNALEAEGMLFLGERPAVEVRLDGGEIDLRAYRLSSADFTSGLSVHGIWKALRRVSAALDVTARVELNAVRLADMTLRDGVLDLTMDRTQLVLRRLSVEGSGGRSVEARLRLPLERNDAADDSNTEQANGWTARAEAAVDVRAGGENGLTWRAGLWDGVLSLETETPVRSRLTGTFGRTDKAFGWTDVRGRIGRASVKAGLSYTPGERPVLTGSVSTDKAVIGISGGEGDNLWPGWPLAAYWPGDIDIHLDWRADDLEVMGARLGDAEGTAVLEKDTARLNLISGTLFGGAATGTASLTMGPDGTAEWESRGVVQRADLAALFGGGWQGRGTFRQTTSGSGTSIAEIVAGLRGTAGLDFEEGHFGGLDVTGLATSLSGAATAEAAGEAIAGAFGEGATPFRKLEGEARIGNGELVLSGISAQGPEGPVMLAGIVNLRARLIAAQADISLGEKVGAPLSVQFIGRMEAPERIVDTERLTERLMQ